jgi:hypothetical protein
VYPRRGLTVRLACVKHAASVRPEPGSNSPLKSIGCGPEGPVPISTSSIADVRSIAGSYCQSIKGTELEHWRTRSRARGICAYLALTFSTLLSSQISGAHLTGPSAPARGNLTNFMRYTRPSQTRFSRSPSQRRPKHPDQIRTSEVQPAR